MDAFNKQSRVIRWGCPCCMTKQEKPVQRRLQRRRLKRDTREAVSRVMREAS